MSPLTKNATGTYFGRCSCGVLGREVVDVEESLNRIDPNFLEWIDSNFHHSSEASRLGKVDKKGKKSVSQSHPPYPWLPSCLCSGKQTHRLQYMVSHDGSKVVPLFFQIQPSSRHQSSPPCSHSNSIYLLFCM